MPILDRSSVNELVLWVVVWILRLLSIHRIIVVSIGTDLLVLVASNSSSTIDAINRALSATLTPGIILYD